MERRAGFTLVELLLVIAIIGVLIALLLPAVQAAREAARRTQCTNNLKQIGLAVHNYHTVFGSFPPGNVVKTAGVCPGNAGAQVESEDATNWLISILPYVEQKALYDEYDFEAYNESPPNRRVRETLVSTYVCPSDVGADKLTVPGDGPARADQLNITYMPGSYRAMTGRSNGFRYLDSGQISNYPRPWRGAIHMIGALGFRTESVRHVGDGTSNTLMAGESTTRTSPAWRTFWAYSFAHFSLSAATPQARILLGDYDECSSVGGTGHSTPCRRGWGSFHGTGLNFLVCDGSVRFLGDTIDLELFTKLATIDGRDGGCMPD